jgi:hypothetical protein
MRVFVNVFETTTLKVQQVETIPDFCDRKAAHKAGSMSHGKPAADAISLTI